MYNIVFMGKSGSGKGTQINLMIKNGYHKISIGDILRNEIAKDTSLGKSVKKLLEKGKLISDDLVIKLLSKELDNHKTGIIFDGFPRTLNQAKKLEKILKKKNIKLDCVIEIDTPDSVILDRIRERYTCKKCGASYNKKGVQPKKEGICDVCGGKEFITRQDDEINVVKTRLKDYKKTSKDILNYYKKIELLYIVSGASGSQTETNEQVETVLRIINLKNELAKFH